MTTRDPLYWGLILGMGVIAGILAYYFDRQHKPLGVLHLALYVLVSVFGAAVGAHFVGPVLQIAVNFIFRSPAAEIQWPAPVSMNGFYLFIGTVVGTMLFNTVARLVSRGADWR